MLIKHLAVLILLGAVSVTRAQTPAPATYWPAGVNAASAVHYFIGDPNAAFVTPGNWQPSLAFAGDGDQAYDTFFFKTTSGLESVDNFMNLVDTGFKAWADVPVVDVLLQVYGNEALYNEDARGREITFRIGALGTENVVSGGAIPTGANNGQWNWMLFTIKNDLDPADGKRYIGDVPNPAAPNVQNGGVNGGTIRIEGVRGIIIRAAAIGPVGAFGTAKQVNVFVPVSPEWIRLSKSRGQAAQPRATKISETVSNLSDVEIGTGGDHALHANIALPKNPPKNLPAVVWIHGGSWDDGSYADNMAESLAERGYFTMSVEYRSSDEAKWPAQLEDCKLAVRWLRANAGKYGVNPDRIGVWGQGAGGQLAEALGTPVTQDGEEAISSQVQAVVAFSAPANMARLGDTELLPKIEKLLGGSLASNPGAWRNSSPVARVTHSAAPMLIVHGEQDRLVPIEQAELLIAALKKDHVPAQFIRVKNGDHGLREDVNGDAPAAPDQTGINAAVLAFFDRYLKK